MLLFNESIKNSREPCMPQEKEIIIGYFFPQPASGSRVFVSIYATNEISGEVEIRDSENQIYHSNAFELVKEGDALEVDIRDLSPGNYLALLTIEDTIWERVLIIE